MAALPSLSFYEIASAGYKKNWGLLQYLCQNKNTYKKMANSLARNRVISAKPGLLYHFNKVLVGFNS
jgi:hypothetical protein